MSTDNKDNMTDCEKANAEFPARNDIWRNKQTGLQYEVISVTNDPKHATDQIVSIFNHQEGKAKIVFLSTFINSFEKICEFPDR